VSLNAYVGQGDVRIAFHGISEYGNDCHVDDVAVTYAAPGGCNVSACTPGGLPPGETGGTPATHVKWIAGTTYSMEWGATPDTDHYHLYRGTPAQLVELLDSDVDSCRLLDDLLTPACTGLTEVPASGSFFWYLVTAWNAYGEGPAGNGSGGERVRNSTESCP
jgi:hypothetical protein